MRTHTKFGIKIFKIDLKFVIEIKLYLAFTPLQRAQGGGGGTLIFSHIRRLGPFFGVQNSEFQYFFGISEK